MNRTDSNYYAMRNRCRADLNAAHDFLWSAYAHDLDRPTGAISMAIARAMSEIETALKAMNPPRPVCKYRVKKIRTRNFYAVPRKKQFVVRRYGTAIARICSDLNETAETIDRLQLFYDKETESGLIAFLKSGV